MKLVLVGPPLSGKTTLLKELQKLGIKTFEADKFTEEIYQRGNEGFDIIAEEFGSKFVSGDKINKRMLTAAAINNPESLKRLNELIHKIIEDEFQNGDYQVGELPLIIFSKNDLIIDKKVLFAPVTKDIIIERIEKTSRNINKEFIKFVLPKWDIINEEDFDYVIKVTNEKMDYKKEAKVIVELFLS